MKILHVEMGRLLDGGARQLAYLLNGLEKYPGDHVLVCPGVSELPGALANQSVKILRLKTAEEQGVKLMRALRKIIAREKPNMLHIHGRPGDWASILAGKRERRPIIYSRREDRPTNSFHRYFKYPLFSRVIAMSPAIRRELLEASVPAEKVIYVPCAVDLERFKPAPKTTENESFRAEFGWRGAGPVLAVAAQLAKNKGHAVLFGALPAVLAKYPDTRVLVLGRGPAKDELQRELERRGLEKYVRLAGHRPDLEHILPRADMLVHPSFEDGVGVVVMEASACGIPVIASRVGGIPDIVQDGLSGYLVKPGDSINLARHIVMLLDDREQLLHFGRTAREIAVDKFAMERLINGHREIYRSV